jgi:putative nucleotidyltransferase with HDIG domain
MMALLRQIVALEQYDGVDRSHAGDRPEPAGRSFDDLYLFANISKQFRSLRLKPPVIGKLLNRLLSAMEGDAAFLHFQDYPQYNLIDIRSDAGEAVRPAVVERIVTQGVAHCRGNYCIVDNSAEDERFAGLSDGPLRLMAVAVRHIKQHFGWMGLIGFVPDRPFQNDALNIMQTLANQLAVMAANMERYDDMERFTVNIVCSLVNAIESKDAYCQGHSKRVHQYVMEMARQMELPADETEALKWAAVLHDIGKIGIPEKVLCKPGKLTDKEFELIRQHPVKGKTILAPIRQLEPSMPAIAHHHERFDGSGYPDGLRGEEIPLAARMIAVADTYDALTSNRSYRETRTPGQALAVMERAAGTQLDPDLVAVFKTSCRRLCNALRN